MKFVFGLLKRVAAFWLVLGAVAHAEAKPFSGEQIEALARKLAQQDHVPPKDLEGPLASLTYDQFRDIRFRPDRALWKAEKLPFQVQLFHEGWYYRAPVQLWLVDQGQAQPLAFSRDLFDYGPLVPPMDLEATLPFAGFRVHYPLNRPEYFDELLVFLGASYFRALGKGNVYGLSARGLSVDTAVQSGEEFPAFRSFWLEKPAKNARELVIHALLDSPSVTGAYRFVVHPGEVTRIDVSAVLFTRRDIERIGLAPLTSMYLHGENDRGKVDDFRPEVHDSDGLLIWNGTGERLWRPLANPARLRVSSFETENLKGFGLLQRDQAFSSYEDLEARYDRRPGLWVETLSGFERGVVHLVEIPTQEEIHDNIVAIYTPQKPVRRNETLRLSYRLYWGRDPTPHIPASTVTATRAAPGPQPERRRFLVDFSAYPGKPNVSTAPVEPVVWTSQGRIVRAEAQPNPVSGGWRVVFEVEPGGDDPTNLRCFLKQGSDTLSETWTDQLTP